MKMKITYVDGREIEIFASPRAQVETERHFKGLNDPQKLESSFYLAWASLHYGGREASEFEAWLDLVIEVDDIKAEEADEEQTDPTPATPSPIGSSG